MDSNIDSKRELLEIRSLLQQITSRVSQLEEHLDLEESELKETAKKLGITIDKSMGRGRLIDEIFGEKCEKNIIHDIYITNSPLFHLMNYWSYIDC